MIIGLGFLFKCPKSQHMNIFPIDKISYFVKKALYFSVKMNLKTWSVPTMFEC